ncbi:hypothetical protein BH160DRAFT_2054 [Burkholderia sp. H160]|nr:hypothetical protein BH160DRAFT_2054 [Burkholderia sp. H160]
MTIEVNDVDESRLSVAASNADADLALTRIAPHGARPTYVHPNWAWASPKGLYDWMDSNSPFIGLE